MKLTRNEAKGRCVLWVWSQLSKMRRQQKGPWNSTEGKHCYKAYKTKINYFLKMGAVVFFKEDMHAHYHCYHLQNQVVTSLDAVMDQKIVAMLLSARHIGQNINLGPPKPLHKLLGSKELPRTSGWDCGLSWKI